MADETMYIWIVRWEEFQHYVPRPDRGPAWIKDYTAQLSDQRYLDLTDRQRALLRDLRDVFATFRGRLPDDRAMIAGQRNRQTRDADMETLNHAGFIDIVSREVLDQRLEFLYSSRAPARSLEVEEEKETTEPEPEPVPRGHVDNGAGAGPDDIETIDPDEALAEALKGNRT